MLIKSNRVATPQVIALINQLIDKSRHFEERAKISRFIGNTSDAILFDRSAFEFKCIVEDLNETYGIEQVTRVA